MTPKEVLEFAKENKARVVDLRFLDFPGLWQHFTVPMSELEESSFEDGFGFDGSSIRGWQPIHASDMLVVPDPATAKMDPFFEVPTLVLIGNIVDLITRESYTRDPRNIAKKAGSELQRKGPFWRWLRPAPPACRWREWAATPGCWSRQNRNRPRSSIPPVHSWAP